MAIAGPVDPLLVNFGAFGAWMVGDATIGKRAVMGGVVMGGVVQGRSPRTG